MKTLNIAIVTLSMLTQVIGQDFWEKTGYKYAGDESISDMVCLNDNIYVTRASQGSVQTDMTMDGFETWDTFDADLKVFCSTSEGILFARKAGKFPSERYFLKSQDNGKTWIKVKSPDSTYINLIAVGQNPDAIPHDILYARTRQFYASHDLGVSWIRIKTPDSCDVSQIFLNNIGDVYGISPINSKIIRLSHGATEWIETLLEFPQEWKDGVDDLKFHPDGHIYMLFNEMLFILRDGEDQFKKIDLPENKIVSCICINDSGVVYIGSRLGGVHNTNDNGITWENFGLDTLSIWNIVSDSHGVLFASAPEWQEIYKTAKSTTNIENNFYNSTPSNYNLSQNYPNPFNPSTTIEFSLPKSELVELKVYNILGKEVATLVSNKLNQGNHTYTFDGKNLASGIYYYQLVAGDYRQVKKMILLK